MNVELYTHIGHAGLLLIDGFQPLAERPDARLGLGVAVPQSPGAVACPADHQADVFGTVAEWADGVTSDSILGVVHTLSSLVALALSAFFTHVQQLRHRKG